MNEKKTGIIIVNLGSPESHQTKDVRTYLNEFLMDERVMDMPVVSRHLLVKGLIVPFRAAKSAKAYRTVWTDEGSPLIVITRNFAELVEKRLQVPVSIAMRYGNPHPSQALKELEAKTTGLESILIAPMYPHYAMSSYETAVEHISNFIREKRRDIKLHFLKPFYNEPAYISSIATTARPFLSAQSFDGYLFSYHGLPIRHLKKSDTTHSHCYSSDSCCEIKSVAWQTCYKHQVKTTTKLVAEELGLDPKKVIVSFQSRLGSDKWIQPFTDKLFEELPAQGVRKLMVFCLSFVADCLETLEEIEERGKESFLKSGGGVFVRVPCLNTSQEWLDTFVSYCQGYETSYKDWWTQ